ECRGLPVSPRYAGHQALTARAAAIATRHVGRCASLVDENQAFRVQFALACTPLITLPPSPRSVATASASVSGTPVHRALVLLHDVDLILVLLARHRILLGQF